MYDNFYTMCIDIVMSAASRKRQRESKCGASAHVENTSARKTPTRACKKQKRDESLFASVSVNSVSGAGYKTKKLWTSYGEVSVPVYDFGNANIALQNPLTGMDGKPIYIKCVDATRHGIDPNRRYNLDQLARLQPTALNLARNKQVGKYVAKRKEEGASNEQLRAQLVELNSADIHFLTNEYVHFLHDTLGLNNINDKGLLLSVHALKGMDNAYFSGHMMYGDGQNQFVALGKADVTGHELGHGIVQDAAGLEYRGESGALNESMSDVFGVCFEFWLYRKYNNNEDEKDDLSGSGDWLLGEDVSKAGKYLRNIMDPNKARQPDKYQGTHWADPNNENIDYGGVHINSGITNKCFFLVAQNIGLTEAFRLWYRTLQSLTPTSSFTVFRDQLKAHASKKEISAVRDALKQVGLTDKLVSIWRA